VLVLGDQEVLMRNISQMYVDCCHYSSFFPAVLAKIGQDRGRKDSVVLCSELLGKGKEH